MTVTAARGTATIVQEPTEANGFETSVEFDDDAFGAEAWYDITLHFNLSCQLTVVNNGLPSGAVPTQIVNHRIEAPWHMGIDFDASLHSHECHRRAAYRQMVMGWFQREGEPQIPVSCGNEEGLTHFIEDCTNEFSPSGPGHKYGHQEDQWAHSRFWRDGLMWRGYDRPAIAGYPGQVVELHLDFEGRIIDTEFPDQPRAVNHWQVHAKVQLPQG